MYEGKKHLFFDLDNTLTQHKGRMEDDMHELLQALPHNKVIVSGTTIAQIELQTRNLPLFRLAHSGNLAIDLAGTALWNDELTESECGTIFDSIISILKVWDPDIKEPASRIQKQGSQITFSLLPRDAAPEIKSGFDPDKKKRIELLNSIKHLTEGMEIFIAGSTSFDCNLKGKNKAYNIERFIAYMKWNKEECLFFGDAFFSGGNDECVKGVIDIVEVADPKETYRKLAEISGSPANRST